MTDNLKHFPMTKLMQQRVDARKLIVALEAFVEGLYPEEEWNAREPCEENRNDRHNTND